MKRFLKINAADNVAVALADDLHEGETLDVEGVAVTLREDVARGHKFALRDIAAGENVVKYGYPIGHATQDVPQGGWIHTHNLKPTSATTSNTPMPPRFTMSGARSATCG